MFLPIKSTTRLFTTLNLFPGPQPEAPISSETFLRSFLDTGVWMRSLAMESHVLVLADTRASRLQRLAACVAIYQQLGLAIEDALATLIAWSIWAHDKSISLPDLTFRLHLRTDPQGSPYDPQKLKDIRSKFAGGKKISVDGRRYLSTLVKDVRDADLPGLFGVPWKARPSVKLVSPAQMTTWTTITRAILDHVQILTEPSGELTAAYYNKLKHGPQLVVDNPRQAALRLGHSESDTKEIPDTELIRVLLAGAQTSVTPQLLASGQRIAPFLLDDADNARRILRRRVLDGANFLYSLGYYLFIATFP